LVSASKEKGTRGENEVVKLLVKAGLTEAKRMPLSGAVAGFEGDVFLNGWCVETKRTERLDLWVQACAAARGGRHPILFFRRNHSDWLVTLDARTWAGEQAELRELREADAYRKKFIAAIDAGATA
jgi:Holliday junction resolvase